MNRRLYIIDANNLVHRAAVINEMSVKDILKNVNSMIDSFLFRSKAKYVVAVFDHDYPVRVSWPDGVPGGLSNTVRYPYPISFDAKIRNGVVHLIRQELYPEYKSNRLSRDNVEEAIDASVDLFKSKRIRCLLPPVGHESDDMIASLARAIEKDQEWGRTVEEDGFPCSSSKIKVVILSTDFDFIQSVTDHIVLGTRRQENNLVYNTDKIFERWGIRPEQWPGVIALSGKPSNNIPGLSGIGIKGACSLIAEYGNIQNLINNADSIKRNGHRNAILEDRHLGLGTEGMLKLYLSLVTLRTDLETDTDLDTYRIRK